MNTVLAAVETREIGCVCPRSVRNGRVRKESSKTRRVSGYNAFQKEQTASRTDGSDLKL